MGKTIALFCMFLLFLINPFPFDQKKHFLSWFIFILARPDIW